MNSIKIIKFSCFFIFIQSCVIFKDNQGVGSGNTVMTIGSYTIYSPNVNVNYTYNDIINNIEQINKAKEQLKEDLIKIDDAEKQIKVNNETTQKQKDEQIAKLNEKRQIVSQNLPKLDKTFTAWENLGFFNEEFREKTDDFDEMEIDDFAAFIDLKEGDYAGDATKKEKLGNPTKNTKTKLIYEYKGKEVVIINFHSSNGKIHQIEVNGKEGYDFLASRKIKDDKYKLIGLKRYKIQEILGKPYLNYKNSINYGGTYDSRAKKAEIDFVFTNSKNQNNTCISLVVKWTKVFD